MTTIQVRIDEKTKKSAKKVLDKLGIDMSAAIKLYFNQIITRDGIPFRLMTENGLTPDDEEQVMKASDDAHHGKNVTGKMSVKEAIEYLQSM